MEIVIEIIIEIIGDIISEIVSAIVESEKVPKAIRALLISVIGGFVIFLCVFLGLGVTNFALKFVPYTIAGLMLALVIYLDIRVLRGKKSKPND